MDNLSIGGQMVPQEGNESITILPQNKTMLIERLTDEPPLTPDFVKLTTVKEVFEYFKPSKEVEFEAEDGNASTEQLVFQGLDNFGKNGIIKQSQLLSELSKQYEDLQKFVTRLKQNKALKTVLENPEAKEAYMAVMKNLLDKLDNVE